MKMIVLDFETYYSSDYSLRKMTPVEYILDPRFETIGCAVKEGDGKSFWLTHEELIVYLAGLPDKVCIISHNALFDMCVLAWRYNYVPHLMIDTMGMARAVLQCKLRRLSLEYIAEHLGIGLKGKTVHKVAGMGLAAIKAAGFYDEYAEYSCNDADLCWDIYRRIRDMGFPVSEVAVMDTVLRCAVKPKFELDRTLLAQHLNDTIEAKRQLMEGTLAHATRDDLMSNDRFAALLKLLGVDPPMKTSLATGLPTYAFAKTDPEFIALEEHDDPRVQALVAARLGIKSTIEETRTQRLINIANLTWPGNTAAMLPVALRFSGAHTHRLSGDWQLNLQNLPSRVNNTLRRAIVAPKGKVVVAVDASQIEARIAAWYCGQDDMVHAFANKEDIYSSFASTVFGYPVNKKEHPSERFIGKTGILGLQYGLGWMKFQKTVALQSKAQVGTEIMLTDEEAARVVALYRSTYNRVPAKWRFLDQMIARMSAGTDLEDGPLQFMKEKILLPSGLYLYYHDLRNEPDTGNWRFTYGGNPKFLYGGKLLENIIQALARICVMDAAVRVRRKYGFELALQVHDELVYVVDEADAPGVVEAVIAEMRTPPTWGLDIPLDAEGGIGYSYGDAK